MGRLVCSMMVSVDGLIAEDETFDGWWMNIDEELHRYVNDMTAGAGHLLYGRKSYEVMIPAWPDAAGGGDDYEDFEIEFGKLWVDKPKTVFSRTLKEAEYNTQVVSDDMLGHVRGLRDQSEGVLLFGGADVASQLEEAELVDEYHLIVQPAALGNGVPLFRTVVPLELVDVRPFACGATVMRYVPDRSAD